MHTPGRWYAATSHNTCKAAAPGDSVHAGRRADTASSQGHCAAYPAPRDPAPGQRSSGTGHQFGRTAWQSPSCGSESGRADSRHYIHATDKHHDQRPPAKGSLAPKWAVPKCTQPPVLEDLSREHPGGDWHLKALASKFDHSRLRLQIRKTPRNGIHADQHPPKFPYSARPLSPRMTLRATVTSDCHLPQIPTDCTHPHTHRKPAPQERQVNQP